MRRGWASLVALAVIGTILLGAAPASANHKVALGITKSNGGEGIAAFDAFTAGNGDIAPNLWTLRSRWGGPDKAFPTVDATSLHARGAVPVIWWMPMDPANQDPGKYEKLQNIIKGNHDDYITQWALAAKALNETVIVRFAHEANVSVFLWGKNWFNNSPKKYRKAWKHVVAIFNSVDAHNVDFLWSMAKQTCKGCNPYKKYYPGDFWVDYVGFSGFNWGGYAGRPWTSMVSAYTQPMKKFKQFTNKPIVVAENASSHKNGNKAKWIKNGYKGVRAKWHKIKGILYLDSDEPHNQFGHPRWRLAKPSDGSAANAYRNISARSEFTGSLD